MNALSSWATLNQNARNTFEKEFVTSINKFNIEPLEFPKFRGYSAQVDELTKTFYAFLEEQKIQGDVKGELNVRFFKLIEAKNLEIQIVSQQIAERVQKVALATIKAIAHVVNPNDLPEPKTAFGGSVNKELYSQETIMHELIKGSVTFPVENPQAALYIIKICFDILKEEPKQKGIILELDYLLEQILEITGDAEVLKSMFFKAVPLINSLLKAKEEAQAQAAALAQPRIRELEQALAEALQSKNKEKAKLLNAERLNDILHGEIAELKREVSAAAKPQQPVAAGLTDFQSELAQLSKNAS